MRQNLDDIIYTLMAQIWDSKKGIDRQWCVIYLRSTFQKYLFAERRLKRLTEEIEGYIQTVQDDIQTTQYNQVPSSLNIEMDFDHCVLSLRSSLEHLAQLINVIIPLNLSPKATKGETHVTLKNVIGEIRRNDLLKSNECLSNLSSYLSSEMEKDWYRDLHDLRITMFHDKSDRLIRILTQTLERQLLDLKFLLPSDAAKSLVTEEERNIISYCENATRKVEGVLKETFGALSKYLSQ